MGCKKCLILAFSYIGEPLQRFLKLGKIIELDEVLLRQQGRHLVIGDERLKVVIVEDNGSKNFPLDAVVYFGVKLLV